MGRDHRGKPSGINKGIDPTGIPNKITPETLPENLEISEKYTEDENDIAENVHLRHPNRNTDKDDATNIGGYRG
jgi:hypothetical protein